MNISGSYRALICFLFSRFVYICLILCKLFNRFRVFVLRKLLYPLFMDLSAFPVGQRVSPAGRPGVPPLLGLWRRAAASPAGRLPARRALAGLVLSESRDQS